MQTLAVPHTMIDKEGARDLKIDNGEVKFDRVSFMYGRNIGGLKDVSLRINAGEKLGVVGASGAKVNTRLYTSQAS